MTSSAPVGILAILLLFAWSMPGLQERDGGPLGLTGPGYGLVGLATGNGSVDRLPSALAASSISVASVAVGAGPYQATVDPTTGWIYVANSASNNVSVINGTSVVATIPVGSFPCGVLSDPGNGFVYVLDGWSNDVYVVSGTGTIAKLPVGGGPCGYSGQDGAALDTANGYVYTANSGSNNVSVINGTTIVASIPVGDTPAGIAVDSVTGYAYIANLNSGNVSVINGTSVVASIGVRGYPVAAVFDRYDGNVYVASQEGAGTVQSGEVSVIHGTSVKEIINVGMDPFGIALDSTHHYVDVSNRYSNSLSVVSGSSSFELPTGTSPEGIGFDSVNAYAYVANSGSNNVSVINGTSIVGSIPVGFTPASITFNPGNGNIYVLDSGSGNVSVLNGSVTYPTLNSFNANPSTVQLGSPTTFLANATVGSGTWAYSYSGLPSNCASSDSPALTCTPATPGVYSVRVNASNSEGISSTATTVLTVLTGNVSYFAANPSIVEIGSISVASTTFSLRSSGGIGTPAYAYTGLPNGCASASSPTLLCKPTSSGLFSVRVYVNDTANNSFTATTSLTVVGALGVFASATPNPTDAGAQVNFTSIISGGLGPYVHAWSFGDGEGSTSSNPTHRYAVAGYYVSQVWVNDSLGGTATLSLAILSDGMLHVSLAASNSTPVLGQFVAVGSNVSGGAPPYSYGYYGLPTGCVSADLPTLSCRFVQAGPYNLSVAVTDGNGVLATAWTTVIVVFDFTVLGPASVTVGEPFTISVNPATEDGTVDYSYTGLPGGCNSSNTPRLVCTPTIPGDYSISVSAHDQAGHQATHKLAVNVIQAPTQPLLQSMVVGGAIAAVALAAVVAILSIRRRKERKPPPEPGTG